MERRNIERKNLVFYLRVFSSLSGGVLGYMRDISPGGFMLITESHVSGEQELELRMRLPTLARDQKEIIVPATTRWCRSDGDRDLFLAGFQMENLERTTSQLISNLIRDFGFERPAVFPGR